MPFRVRLLTRSGSTKVTLLISLLLATGLISDLQGVGMAPLVGVITKDFGLTTNEITWVLNALLIGGAIGVGLTSRLGDIKGHRKILLWLSFCGLAGSLLAAVAFNAWMLVIGRFLQGLAVATPLAWGLLRPMAKSSQIRLAASLLSIVICVFTPVSLVLGGGLLYLGYGWQGVFWILAALYVIMILLAFVSPEAPVSSRSKDPLDIVGTVGLGIWLTGFLLAISYASKLGFLSFLPLVLFGSSLALFAAWVVQQRNHSHPLMDFTNVDMRQMLGGYLGLIGSVSAAGALYILLPAMLIAKPESGHGFGLTTFEASLPLLGILPGAYVAPMLLRKALVVYGPKLSMAVLGFICAISFVGLAYFMTELWHAYFWVVVYGAGVSGCYAAGWAMLASSTRADNTGILIAGMTVTQKIVGAIAAALVLMALNPGAGPASTEVFQMSFLAVAIACVAVLVVLALVVVPSQLLDRHAADSN